MTRAGAQPRQTAPPAIKDSGAPRPPLRAVGLFAAGLLVAVVAIMMIEQSARWLLTSATRASFAADEFQVDYLRDQPGRGGFAYGGRIASTGETIHTTITNIVSTERLRELEAAGAIPGAREPVHYLASRSGWAALDALVAFRIQSPDTFETEAAGWVVINLLFAAGAVWLIRRGVRLVKQAARDA